MFEHIFYYLIAFLNMFLESSFLPFPSEPLILYLAYLINQNILDFWITYFILNIGTVCGALLNYFLAKKYGLKFFKKYINTKIIVEYLDKFKRDQCFYTFAFRFVPLLRQIMSIPAGIVKMDLKKFIFFTLLGAGIWNFILLYLSVKLMDIELIKKNLLVIGIGMFLFIIIYYFIKNKVFKKYLK